MSKLNHKCTIIGKYFCHVVNFMTFEVEIKTRKMNVGHKYNNGNV